MNGKAKCKILKEIRRQIAENNDIAYTVYECPHKGDCKGTCPTCEAEVAYLENELNKRRALGKTVLVAGLAASIMVTSTGCVDSLFSTSTQGAPEAIYTEETTEDQVDLMGRYDNTRE